MILPSLVDIDWQSWRIIPSRYPTIDLFNRVASPEEFDVLYHLESLTNDRLREETGALHLVPKEERIFGAGASFIMSAFTHLNPQGSRFSDGTWGVYYGAHDLKTAIAETKYHREIFMARTNEPPMTLEMRVLMAQVKGPLHDIRETPYQESLLYAPNDYQDSWALARELKGQNSFGVVYWSVRQPQGQNIGVFRPKIISHCRQERHLDYVWDGQKIAHVFEKKLVAP